MSRPQLHTLAPLLAPASVAIVGASDDPTRIGGRPVSYLLRAGFAGPIWPVNPNRETVQGLLAYPSIVDVPDSPDACIIAVPAPLVTATLEACADRGAKAAIVLSAGFAEAGEEGKRAQARISEIARERGIRVLGPNTLGAFNAHLGWMGTFASTVRYGTPEPGPVGIASQSGAVGSELFHLLRRRGVQTGMWITTGNEADVDLADAVGLLADHPGTEVIAAYAEGIRDQEAMREALARASAAGKPVLFLKSGRSEVGALAVEAHTAADAGSDPVLDTLLEESGAVRVRSAEELVDAVYTASLSPLPAGRRLLILTISGGAGVQMADAAADLGLTVDATSTELREKLRALLPFGAVRNPVDTTAQVFNDIGLIGECLRTVLEARDHDAVALFLTSVAASADVAVPLVAELEQARASAPGVPLVVSLAADAELTKPYRDAGYPLFEEPTRAVNAVSLLCRLSESRARGGSPRVATPRDHVWYSRPVFFVSDLQPAIAFYVDELGFTKTWHAEDGQGTVCQVDRGGCEIILAEDGSRRDRGRLFLELRRDAVDQLLERVEARSVPTRRTWWGYDVLAIEDPDGNELLVCLENLM